MSDEELIGIKILRIGEGEVYHSFTEVNDNLILGQKSGHFYLMLISTLTPEI